MEPVVFVTHSGICFSFAVFIAKAEPAATVNPMSQS